MKKRRKCEQNLLNTQCKQQNPEKYVKQNHELSGVILDQNCIWLLDTALDDLSFSNIYFIKNSVNTLKSVAQIRRALL